MEWLFLLLPVAAASGWWMAMRSQKRHHPMQPPPKAPTFFCGLNYLLNEQPDKAIDVFLQLAQVDHETIETHLALGALFRRRGEVERAIRIHQDLSARSELTADQRGVAIYELGRDYLAAGLFDRAEHLFQELAGGQVLRQAALRGLIDIYQQEKDWARCLSTALQLQSLDCTSIHSEIAQFHCELAQAALNRGTLESARQHLAAAQQADPDCMRALLLQAQMAFADGDAQAALQHYHQVAARSPRYVPAILPGLLSCYRRLGYATVASELERLFRAQPSPPLMLELSTALEREQGSSAAREFLTAYLAERADLSGVERLLALRQPDTQSSDAVVLGVVRYLLALQPVYQCDQCGFEAQDLHWQCPSCKSWGSLKAVEPLRRDEMGTRSKQHYIV